jgi:hypothetical protein
LPIFPTETNVGPNQLVVKECLVYAAVMQLALSQGVRFNVEALPTGLSMWTGRRILGTTIPSAALRGLAWESAE